jgi:hypothetical protein
MMRGHPEDLRTSDSDLSHATVRDSPSYLVALLLWDFLLRVREANGAR